MQLPFPQDSPWIRTRDGDPEARALFSRHYSFRRYKDGRNPKKFIGPGEYILLVTPAYDAICAWRKFRSMDNQRGVNNAIFRNENPANLSSELLADAMKIAWRRWPGERLYTYVNPKAVKSANPGYCYKVIGWKFCGTTKRRGYHILEFLPS